MERLDNPVVIAWVQLRGASLVSHKCKLETEVGQSYLVFQLEGEQTIQRQAIDVTQLIKLLPGKWLGVEYFYRRVIRISGAE